MFKEFKEFAMKGNMLAGFLRAQVPAGGKAG
jgi:hypothetical protein